MKRPAMLLLAACLASLVGSGVATAAEGVAEQELLAVEASTLVTSAVWKRQADSYTLQLVLDRSKYLGIVDIREALKSLPPRDLRPQPEKIPNWRPEWGMDLAAERADRESRFIADTVTRLRALDPTFGSHTTTIAGGRRVEAWLLKSDGSVIRPSAASNNISISYAYSAAEAAQAVAVAIKIDNDFYIEKLQPLAAPAVK